MNEEEEEKKKPGKQPTNEIEYNNIMEYVRETEQRLKCGK